MRYRRGSLVAPALLLALAGAMPAQQSPSPVGTLEERIQRVVGRPEFRHALWGIEFYSLDASQPVYALNAEKLFTPGSTTKLLTMGTALELLGADHRFHTRVYRTGTLGADGTLDGDLVLVASGDPNLSGRLRPDGTLAFENEDHSYAGSPSTKAVPGDPLLVLRGLARQIAAHGVKRVRGRVLVDATLFREGARELGTGVVMSPVVVNDNIVDVIASPGAAEGAPASLGVSPATSYVRFVNRATTGAPDSRPQVRWAADSSTADGMHVVTAVGSVPAGKPGILYKYSVPSPTRFAEVALAEALRDAGVEVAVGAAPDRPVDFRPLAASYTPDRVLAEHVSAPFTEEVKVTLKVSQNLHASQTPFVVGALLGGRGDSARTGFDLEHDFLARAGLDLDGAQQGDGAGGDAHFSPAFMVSYLSWMARQKDFAAFHDALPILGRDGTLVDIQPQSAAAGHVHAKTGTFSVYDPLNRRMLVTGKGLAGYMTTADGRRLAFAIYVNNVAVPRDPDAVTRIVGQALGEIAAAAYDAPAVGTH